MPAEDPPPTPPANSLVVEPAPDVSTSQILCAEQFNAYIDADYVRPNPAGIGIESIDKTVPSIYAITEFFSHITQRRQRYVGSKHQ